MDPAGTLSQELSIHVAGPRTHFLRRVGIDTQETDESFLKYLHFLVDKSLKVLVAVLQHGD